MWFRQNKTIERSDLDIRIESEQAKINQTRNALKGRISVWKEKLKAEQEALSNLNK